jgi:hypothetical protein
MLKGWDIGLERTSGTAISGLQNRKSNRAGSTWVWAVQIIVLRLGKPVEIDNQSMNGKKMIKWHQAYLVPFTPPSGPLLL